GFGLVLDGSRRVDNVIRSAIAWDVMGGVARRSWAGNESSITTAIKYNQDQKGTDHITIPFVADEKMVDDLVAEAFSDLKK
ncbi:MAG: urocanate hydratase, partial [Planctomycetota bacterium]